MAQSLLYTTTAATQCIGLATQNRCRDSLNGKAPNPHALVFEDDDGAVTQVIHHLVEVLQQADALAAALGARVRGSRG